MGSSTASISPNNTTLTLTSQSLLLNNVPWLPVSGEFHYSRYPASDWLSELLKMKAAGIDVISTYVIWIHHEEIQNSFDFSGSRDIASFVETVIKAGLSVIVRLGPYVHAEVRNGGIPDWVVAQSAEIRSNDPIYMSFVTSFWIEIAKRINGSIFKHGGPIIGVQLENEYNLDGEGQGAAHIATLKALAISLGFDMPLYTFTGWQNTHYPPDEVVPVFGGYQDAPWDLTLVDEPPNETYLFRFFSREAGSYGYPDDSGGPNAQSELAAYPFLTAEYGGGAASMYRRRVVMDLPDDIAATIPVQLGSGVNLYGYYMFHGGVNPRGRTETLQESTATGSYNDLPVFNYDYQSPLGQYGEQRPTLNRIKQYHYWLNSHGSKLAGMSMRQPTVIPSGSTDLSSLRWSVRSDGESGYLFVNNYVRQYTMATQTDIQFAVNFSSSTITAPSAPIIIPSGRYFVWPLNLSLGSANLVYATAQLMTSLNAFGQTVYIFIATDGVPVEFVFDPDTVSNVSSVYGTVSTDAAGRTIVSSIIPRLDFALHVTDKGDNNTSIIVLNQTLADNLWRITIGGRDILVLTDQAFGLTSGGFKLTSPGSPNFNFATFPAIKFSAPPGSVSEGSLNGLFTVFTGHQQSKRLSVTTTPLQTPGFAPVIQIGGEADGALEPNDTVIQAVQGLWTIQFSWSELAEVDDAWLMINYDGDLARLYSGSLLLDDHFYDGETWVVGLKRLANQIQNGTLTLAVMPLRSDAPVYLQTKPTFGSNGQVCVVTNVTISTVYNLEIEVVS